MTDLVYETPNHEYKVYRNSDALWQEVFGQGATWFSIMRSAKWDMTSDAKPVRQEFSLEDVLKWFWRNNIISRDEMLHGVKELCPEKGLPNG
jgi:hypothetical protein